MERFSVALVFVTAPNSDKYAVVLVIETAHCTENQV